MRKKGLSILRETNKRKVLNIVRKNKDITRTDIVKLTGLSKNTISLIVEELLEENIIYERGTEKNNQVGRPQIILRLQEEALKVLGININSKKITGTLYGYALNELDSFSLPTDLKAIPEGVNELISLFLNKYPSIFGVAVSVPGIVDSDKGIILKSNRLDITGMDLTKYIRHIFKGKIYISNTVKSMSLLMYEQEVTKPQSMFFLNMGGGLGGAYIHDNHVFHGSHWKAGEVGQLPYTYEQEGKFFTKRIEDVYQFFLKKLNKDYQNSVALESIVNIVDDLCLNLNYLYDPEIILIHSSIIDQHLLLEKLEARQNNSNLVFSDTLYDKKAASAFALINKFETTLSF